jgi:hypothetical protein
MSFSIGIKGQNFVRDGKVIRLAGNHTWNTVQPMAGEKIKLDQLTGNFTRLWTVETRGMIASQSSWGSNTPGLVSVDFVPWKKTGDLNKKYYKALEKVVKSAEKKDMVTGVVLFDHAFNAYFPQGWENHPFKALKSAPSGPEYIHTKGPWNQYQRAHVKKIVETLEPYSNVIYEVGNELHRYSVPWFQKKVISWVKKWTDKPVGASYASRVKPSAGRSQNWLTQVDADWIAPSGGDKIGGFKGPQVLDTDHAWALGSNVSGLQKAWGEGRNLWIMDGIRGTVLRNRDNLSPDLNFVSSVL